MKRSSFVLAAFAISVACVPPTESRNPAGAAGFVTEPSAAARGEPVTSSDGWTLVFDKLLVQASVPAQPYGFTPDESGSIDRWILNGRTSTTLFTRALAVGRWAVDITLQQGFLPDPEDEDRFESVMNMGVGGEDIPRFRRVADLREAASWSGSGPAMLVVLRATKGTRAVRLDLTLAPMPAFGDEHLELREVRADALTTGPVGLAPERLFFRPGDQFVFEPVANADANGDGRVTAQELRDAPADPVEPLPQSRYGPRPPETQPRSLGDTLCWRGQKVLVRRGPFVASPSSSTLQGENALSSSP